MLPVHFGTFVRWYSKQAGLDSAATIAAATEYWNALADLPEADRVQEWTVGYWQQLVKPLTDDLTARIERLKAGTWSA